ncbi:CENP-B homolog protein 2-like protein [Tanacetum coccineum]
MACSVLHPADKIKAMVQKQIEEDKVRQLAIMNLVVEYDNASTTKDNLRKAYEKCNGIPQEKRSMCRNPYFIVLSACFELRSLPMLSGANNDLNVLYRSKLFDDILDDVAPECQFTVNVYKWLEENIESVIGINKDDIDEEDDESSTMEPPSRNEAIKAAITLNNFLLSYEKTTPEVLTMLRKIRDEIQGEIDFNKKQKTIESFFKKPS